MLSGIEIVNDERTTAYLLNGLRPPSLDVRGSCSCANIRELAGCDEFPYSTPELDNAPWFSADIPESARFAGFLSTNFEGMGSTFTRSTSETIHDGAVFGRGHLGGRPLTWRGLLLGADCCAVAYGLRWLTKTLIGSTTCQDCNGEDLELLVCCPEIISESFGTLDTGGVEAFRKLKNVALISGPQIISEHITGCGGCGASCVVEIEFTLLAAQPFFYSEPVPVYDCVNIGTNGVEPVTDDTVDCLVTNCGDLILDSLCPPPVLPPTATYSNPCFVDNSPYLATYLTFPRSLWDFLEEVVPVISITTGGGPVTDLQLGFYTSANDNPCGDLLNFPPLCDVICDEIRIIGLPQNSTFFIDGRTKKMALICGPTSIFPGEPLTQGPWSWPSFSDFGFCMEVKFPDPAFSGFTYDDVCISVSLVPRTI